MLHTTINQSFGSFHEMINKCSVIYLFLQLAKIPFMHCKIWFQFLNLKSQRWICKSYTSNFGISSGAMVAMIVMKSIIQITGLLKFDFLMKWSFHWDHIYSSLIRNDQEQGNVNIGLLSLDLLLRFHQFYILKTC